MNTKTTWYKLLLGLLTVVAAWLDQYYNLSIINWGKFHHLPFAFLIISALYLIHLFATTSQIVDGKAKAKKSLRTIQMILLLVFSLLIVARFISDPTWSIVDGTCLLATIILSILPEKLLEAIFEDGDTEAQKGAKNVSEE